MDEPKDEPKNESNDERLATLEKRVSDLEQLINLILTLKSKKLDISNFTCQSIHLNKNH